MNEIALEKTLREQLEADLAKFKANGGTVVEIPLLEQKPRQPCKKLEPYPTRMKLKPYYDFKYNKELREWCSEVKGRGQKLSRTTGYSDTWISHRCQGYQQFRFVDMDQVRPAMIEIEQAEKLSAIAQKHAGPSS